MTQTGTKLALQEVEHAAAEGENADLLAKDFEDALKSAELLLVYSAETGVDVGDATRNTILEARAAVSNGWTKEIAAGFLAAKTRLAAQLKPVTAESLRACSSETQKTARTYWIVAICLAAFIIPASLASFITSAISNAIRADIASANQLAVKLGTQLEPQPASVSSASGAASPLPAGLSLVDVVTEMQTFASTLRTIDTRARQLNWFIFKVEKDPFEGLRQKPAEMKQKLQLPVPLPLDQAGLADVANKRIEVYQEIRSFGQSAVDDVSVFYGALTACILPVLYALLGTCAYMLRSFEREISSRTFIPSHFDSPRFLIAAIGGGVVGLFNNLVISQSISVPPLAIAFLVGYGVDMFFSFLENLTQAFTKSKSGGTS